MNESLANTIMNDIITVSKNNEELLNRIDLWKNILNTNDFIKLSFLYLSFIYEELVINNNKITNEIKNNMKELLFIKNINDDITRYKAVIYTFIKYKKNNNNLF